MKKMLFTFALMALPLFALKAMAQETPTDTTVYRVVEKMPEYPGGIDKLMKYIRTSTEKYWDKVDPKVKHQFIYVESIYRRVVVIFTINENGQVTDPEVLRRVDKDLDKEAIRIIKSMPRWIPGEHKGKKVKVRFTLPVMF
ncbi:MAG: TonB family protein [Bacteroidaceae bacterium]|nr:TonB family protein [Bacteroidaceae bacterium]